MTELGRLVFTEAAGHHAVSTDAQTNQRIASRQSTLLAQRAVVLFSAALVAMTFDGHLVVGVGLEVGRHGFDVRLAVRLHHGLVVVEINAVGLEVFTVGQHALDLLTGRLPIGSIRIVDSGHISAVGTRAIGSQRARRRQNGLPLAERRRGSRSSRISRQRRVILLPLLTSGSEGEDQHEGDGTQFGERLHWCVEKRLESGDLKVG